MDRSGQPIYSNRVEVGQVMNITADTTARYEVICPDGTTVGFIVHAGQSFSLIAGDSGGTITVNMNNVEVGREGDLHLVASD